MSESNSQFELVNDFLVINDDMMYKWDHIVKFKKKDSLKLEIHLTDGTVFSYQCNSKEELGKEFQKLKYLNSPKFRPIKLIK